MEISTETFMVPANPARAPKMVDGRYVTSLDRLEAIAEHGTHQGYIDGCHGSHCPGRDQVGMTCAEANMRFAGDPSYRRRVQAGMSAAAIAAEDRLDAEQEAARVRAAKAPGRLAGRPIPENFAAPTVSFEDSGEPLGEVEQLGDPGAGQEEEIVAEQLESSSSEIPEPEAPKRRGRPPLPFPHGTNRGWERGCRLEACPGVDVTCTVAHEALLADRRAQRDGAPAETTSADEPVADLASADTSRDVDETPSTEPASTETVEQIVLRDRELEAEVERLTSALAESEASWHRKAAELVDMTVERDRLTKAAVEREGRIAGLKDDLALAREQAVQDALTLDVAKSPAALATRPLATVAVPEPRPSGAGLDIRTEDGGVSVRLQGGEPLHLELNFTDGALSGAAVHIGA